MAKEDPAKTARGMRKLIEKRHFKFEQAVLELLCACLAKVSQSRSSVRPMC